MTGMLYLVPTPIGNLSDISVRCRKTLEQADFIAAEDTRVTLKLLNYLEIKKPLVSYYEHNKLESGPKIVRRILDGETCVLVSDAGSPAISDPGEDLVRLVRRGRHSRLRDSRSVRGHYGAVDFGASHGQILLRGFLSINKKSRQEHLAGLQQERRTMIFYEAPHKLLATLKDLANAFGADRRVSLCRELTKLHEEVVLHHARRSGRPLRRKMRQEASLSWSSRARSRRLWRQPRWMRARRLCSAEMEKGLSKKDAVKLVAKQTGLPRNALYEAALQDKD